MSFWKRRKQGSLQVPSDTGKVQKAKRAIKRSPPSAMEIKILDLEALDSGLSAQEVGELVGVAWGFRGVLGARNKGADGAAHVSSGMEISKY